MTQRKAAFRPTFKKILEKSVWFAQCQNEMNDTLRYEMKAILENE